MVVVLSALLAAACTPSPAAQDPWAASSALAVEERAAYESTISRLEAEVRAARDDADGWHRRADMAAAKLGDADCDAVQVRAEAEMAGLRDELDRYRKGLAGAVGELNRRQGPGSVTPPLAVTPTRTDYGTITNFEPRLQVLDGTMVVTGHLWSSRDSSTTVSLTLELLEEQRVIATTQLTVEVPPHSDRTYLHRFTRSAANGKFYSARATPSY